MLINITSPASNLTQKVNVQHIIATVAVAVNGVDRGSKVWLTEGLSLRFESMTLEELNKQIDDEIKRLSQWGSGYSRVVYNI